LRDTLGCGSFPQSQIRNPQSLMSRDLDYHDFVFSMKASNPKVMIAAYRLLVARLNELDAEAAGKGRGGSPKPPGRLRSIPPTWNYPLHLGVTEAGEGEEARIKSASESGRCWRMELAIPSAFRSLRTALTKSPVAKALIEKISQTPRCFDLTSC
jgi:(E)-4-hydroxy-3-methylbut-2-enyl-diphosphate synthase